MLAAVADFVVDSDAVGAAAMIVVVGAVVEQLVEWQLGQVERLKVKLLLLVPKSWCQV